MDVKEKILEVAFELFSEQGFNKTSVAAICKKAECSKGGFYHHFEAKEDVVQVIINNFVYQLIYEFEQLTKDPKLDIIDAMGQIFQIVNDYKKNQINQWPGFIKMLSFEGNDIIIRKMAEEFSRLTTQTYRTLIVRGVEEGVFTVQYPLPLAKLFTRELTSLYGLISVVLMEYSDEKYKELEETATFTEAFLNEQLGSQDVRVKIKDEMIEYVNYAKMNMPTLDRT